MQTLWEIQPRKTWWHVHLPGILHQKRVASVRRHNNSNQRGKELVAIRDQDKQNVFIRGKRTLGRAHMYVPIVDQMIQVQCVSLLPLWNTNFTNRTTYKGGQANFRASLMTVCGLFGAIVRHVSFRPIMPNNPCLPPKK